MKIYSITQRIEDTIITVWGLGYKICRHCLSPVKHYYFLQNLLEANIRQFKNTIFVQDGFLIIAKLSPKPASQSPANLG